MKRFVFGLTVVATVVCAKPSESFGGLVQYGIGSTDRSSGNAPPNLNWDDVTTTVVDGQASVTINDIAGTVDGTNFTYDIQLSGTGLDGTAWPATLGGQRLNDGAGRMNDGDTFTLAISDISDLSVTFDGFTFFVADNEQTGETWIVNGTSYTDDVGGVNLGAGSPPGVTFGTLQPNFVAEVANSDATTGPGLTMSSVEFQFSSIPEPSSFLLVGGAALLGLVAARRRK